MAVKCPVCGQVLRTEADIDAHEHELIPSLEHTGAGFECPVCHMEFDTAENLVTHEATHAT